MALLLFSNNASTTLASPLTTSSTSLSVTAGSGVLFPVPSGFQWFTATLQKIVSGVVTAFEIVKASNASTDAFTILRAQENTTALAWNAGDTFALLTTAGDMGHFVQPDDLQAQAGNYAIDIGSANAYSVTLTPPLVAHVTGMPIRWKAGNANTGVSTFNDGVGPGNLYLSGGNSLVPGSIVTGAIYTSTWTGSIFELGDQTENITGSLALTAVGFSSSSFNIFYRFSNGIVSITVGGSGVSNGTQFAFTGIPSVFVPSATRYVSVAGLTDNGAQLAGGAASISNSGAIAFAPSGLMNFTGWTPTGTKGTTFTCSFTYPI